MESPSTFAWNKLRNLNWQIINKNTKILYFMNLRTIFISSFLSLSSLGVLAQERINLSGTWQFAFAANQKEADRLERFYTSDFAKSKFKSTPVPSNWALLGYEEPRFIEDSRIIKLR